MVTNERIWNERNMSLSKRVILIISPGYLEICKFDEKNNKEKRLESVKDQLAYSEISRIRNEIMEKPLATDRFIVILVRTSRSDLPFWMKKLKIYEYSKGMLDEKILTVLKV